MAEGRLGVATSTATLRALCDDIAQKYGFVLTLASVPTDNRGACLARLVVKDRLCLKLEFVREGCRARFEDYQVPYSSVSQVYSWNHEQQRAILALR